MYAGKQTALPASIIPCHVCAANYLFVPYGLETPMNYKLLGWKNRYRYRYREQTWLCRVALRAKEVISDQYSSHQCFSGWTTMFHAKAQRSTTTATPDEDIHIVIFAQLPYCISRAELEVFCCHPCGASVIRSHGTTGWHPWLTAQSPVRGSSKEAPAGRICISRAAYGERSSQ